MRIGCIFTAWQMEDYLAQSLAPWVGVRASSLDDHEFVICCVSVPFAGFPQDGVRDSTTETLRRHLAERDIDHLIESETSMSEVDARGAALMYLKTQDVDAIWQVDADEVYANRDISRTLRFVGTQPYCGWFRVALVNLVFDSKTRLADPFTPPRIHRVRFAGVEATHFSADNDVSYGPRHQSAFASLTIPEACAAPLHYSWVADSEVSRARCRRKVEYQILRWGQACSFRWDETKGLVFNPALLAPRTLSI